MNKIIVYSQVTFLLISIPAFAIQSNDNALQQQFLQDSRQTAQAFMQALGGTLKEQLTSNGPASAIAVCKHVAPALAADYSKEGLIVSRVSLKNRNETLGKPDAWEQGVLKKFNQEQAEGKLASSLEASAVTEASDGRWFRYMKAIPTQPMCLQCHGQAADISPKVKAVLSKEYPKDKAVDYKAGDIRGAVSIKRKWPEKAE